MHKILIKRQPQTPYNSFFLRHARESCLSKTLRLLLCPRLKVIGFSTPFRISTIRTTSFHQVIIVSTALLIGLAFSMPALCWENEGGNFTVSRMRFGKGGLFIALDPAPNVCNGGNQYRMHFKVDNTSDFYNDMVSGLLTAYTTKIPIAVLWYSNSGTCTTTHIPLLEMFEYK